MTMKIKFDYEKYCTGKYNVQTESGVEVTELVKFTTKDDYCLYGTIKNSVEQWTINGNWVTDYVSNSKDLVLVPKVQKIYKNVYKYIDGDYYFGSKSFKSEQEARESAITTNSTSKYIQTIEIIDTL